MTSPNSSSDKGSLARQIEGCLKSCIQTQEAVLGSLVPTLDRVAGDWIHALNQGHKILFFGNGGSAADSQHLAAELVGRVRINRRALPALALTTDTSALTALANDFGFETVFSRQIEALGAAGDIAFAISTSGNSPNVLAAVKTAKAMGLTTMGLTGRDGGALKSAVDVAVVIPAELTSRIQEAHITVTHILCELVEAHFARS